MNDFKPGLEGIVAVETEFAEPDREGGSLRYRGVDIEDIVGRVPFENVWGLLVDGTYTHVEFNTDADADAEMAVLLLGDHTAATTEDAWIL